MAKPAILHSLPTVYKTAAARRPNIFNPDFYSVLRVGIPIVAFWGGATSAVTYRTKHFRDTCIYLRMAPMA